MLSVGATWGGKNIVMVPSKNQKISNTMNKNMCCVGYFYFTIYFFDTLCIKKACAY